jgi:hypothetical protein
MDFRPETLSASTSITAINEDNVWLQPRRNPVELGCKERAA